MLFTRFFQIYWYVSKQSLTNKNVWLKVFTKVFKNLSKLQVKKYEGINVNSWLSYFLSPTPPYTPYLSN